MATHACVLCKKTRAGRFTRRQDAGSGGWSQGFQLPLYYCYTCLPQGQGRGEEILDTPVHNEEETVTKKPTLVPPSMAKRVLTPPPTPVNKTEGLSLITPLKPLVAQLGRIESEDDYKTADGIFGRIKQARKTWKAKMYGTPAKLGPIPSVRAGLEALYELNREIDRPLEELENQVEKEMKAFKLRELRALQEAEAERQRKEQEAIEALAELERKKALLKTPAARAKVQEQMEEIAETITEAEAPAEKVKGQASEDRSFKTPKVDDMLSFCAGIAEGLIPVECVQLMISKVQAAYRLDPEKVAEWPGVIITDDVQIKGR